jgi:hypothetical protein
VDVSLETGAKRTFASAIAWPGWSRGGKDADAALEALLATAPRYAAAVKGTRLGFRAPGSIEDLEVVERHRGTATTDFGAPDVAPDADAAEVGERELRRLVAILHASWRAVDAAAEQAGGAPLTKGPRGGGRALAKILEHLDGSEESYVRMLGAKVEVPDIDVHRAGVVEALERAVREGVAPGPRGGKRWTPRYFVRRTAWHALDHAWEIEDRATSRTP